ncbi:MAG: phosphoribosylglycinamide formyltransferase, partial [Ignavibacteriaceae bacterium]|nr:phosphoribosylglycinamide formyltransferase [Ignavibacteriaceae bacterium]
MLNIAVFVSGRGSNLKAVLENSDLNNLIMVKAVISDKPDCAAFNLTDEYGIAKYCIGKEVGKISFDDLTTQLKLVGIELIVLAGFLKLIPASFIKEFRNKIINIHPALLPSFGGKGMYGMNVHEAVFQSSAKVSGATVHFIDENYDAGAIITQRCI